MQCTLYTGFSFASSTAAAGGGSTAASSGPGFSFSTAAAGSTPAAAAGSAPSTFTTPAGSAAATAAGTAGAGGSGAAAGAGNNAPAATIQPHMPVAIKGRNVEEIINEWNSELEQQAQMFVKHAMTLAGWDRHILTNRHALLEVEGNAMLLLPQAVVAGQDALERKLFLLETHQKEIHDALSSIEIEAERMCASERSLMDNDTVDRDRLYTRAEAISSALMSLGTELQSAVANINDLNAAAVGDTSSPVGAVVRILNNQLQALTQIDTRASDLNAELERIAAGARQQTSGLDGSLDGVHSSKCGDVGCGMCERSRRPSQLLLAFITAGMLPATLRNLRGAAHAWVLPAVHPLVRQHATETQLSRLAERPPETSQSSSGSSSATDARAEVAGVLSGHFRDDAFGTARLLAERLTPAQRVVLAASLRDQISPEQINDAYLDELYRSASSEGRITITKYARKRLRRRSRA
eukprot:366410-Chlamydomonas_euryale.AAC.6